MSFNCILSTHNLLALIVFLPSILYATAAAAYICCYKFVCVCGFNRGCIKENYGF